MDNPLNIKRYAVITQTEKIIEEYVFMAENTEFSIKGRICEIITPSTVSPCYTWSVSHFYRPTESAKTYHPSIITADSIEMARRLLFAYINGYSGLHLTPNKYH